MKKSTIREAVSDFSARTRARRADIVNEISRVADDMSKKNPGENETILSLRAAVVVLCTDAAESLVTIDQMSRAMSSLAERISKLENLHEESLEALEGPCECERCSCADAGPEAPNFPEFLMKILGKLEGAERGDSRPGDMHSLLKDLEGAIAHGMKKDSSSGQRGHGVRSFVIDGKRFEL
jgi:hypothetical protein